MALTTFSPFSRLPKELREYIWDLAIRPMQPAAHFFTSLNFREGSWLARAMKKYTLITTGRPRKPGICAPCFDIEDPITFSWTESNPSAYLIDTALWTTCQESRQAMERRFGELKPHRRAHAPRHASGDEPCTDFALSSRFLVDDRVQYLTTRSQSDLYCIQPFHFAEMVMFELDLDIALSRYFPRQTITHIAFEHASSCGFRQDNHFSRRVATKDFLPGVVLQLDWVENIWLIDYRLTRCKDEPSAREGRCQFFSNGYRYVEVLQNDEEWEIDCPGNDIPDEDDGQDHHNYARCDTFTMITDAILIARRHAAEGLDPSMPDYEAYANPVLPALRVLACEKMGSSGSHRGAWLTLVDG